MEVLFQFVAPYSWIKQRKKNFAENFKKNVKIFNIKKWANFRKIDCPFLLVKLRFLRPIWETHTHTHTHTHTSIFKRLFNEDLYRCPLRLDGTFKAMGFSYKKNPRLCQVHAQLKMGRKDKHISNKGEKEHESQSLSPSKYWSCTLGYNMSLLDPI